MAQSRLNSVAEKYQTDKKIPNGVVCQNGLYGHGYTPHYADILNQVKVVNLLEIGISFGGSLKMWADYFPYAHITGIDIEEKRFKRSEIETDMIRVVIGDATSDKDLEQVKDRLYDVIIDDGSHKLADQIKSLQLLWSNLATGGVYFIEDLHVSENLEALYMTAKAYGKCALMCDNKLLAIWK